MQRFTRRLIFFCAFLIIVFRPSISFSDTLWGSHESGGFTYSAYFENHDIRGSNRVDGSWMYFEVENSHEFPVKIRLKTIATCNSGRVSHKTEEKIIGEGESIQFRGKYCSGRSNDYVARINSEKLKETHYEREEIFDAGEWAEKRTYVYDWHSGEFAVRVRYRITNPHETPREYFLNFKISRCFKEGHATQDIKIKVGRVEPGASTSGEVAVCQYSGKLSATTVNFTSSLETGDLGKLPPQLFYAFDRDSDSVESNEIAAPKTQPKTMPYEIHLVNKCDRSIDLAVIYQESSTGIWSHVNERVALTEVAPDGIYVVRSKHEQIRALAAGPKYYVWYKLTRGNKQFKGKYPYFVHATGRNQFFNRVSAAPEKNNTRNVDVTALRC